MIRGGGGSSGTSTAEARRAAIAALVAQAADQRVRMAAAVPPVSRDLDPDQLAAVNCSEQTVRIIAPAGAGKTHCMANRVLREMQSGTQANRILLLTFDKNAKGELKARLERLLGPNQAPSVYTLNAFGLKLLQRGGKIESGVRLISRHRALRLIQPIVDRSRRTFDGQELLPDRAEPRLFLDLISFLKNQLCYARPNAPDEVAYDIAVALANLPPDVKGVLFAKVDADSIAATQDRAEALVDLLAAIFVEYEVTKRRTGEIDFDDQKLDAYRLLELSGEVRDAVESHYRLVIVDEFQDLNELDFRLILRIAAGAALVVVGDDDQAIYGFRGTSPKYILEFERLSGRKTRTVVLNRNYRCPANIVRHASVLIANNRARVEKNPVAARSTVCDIRVYNLPTVDAEAAAIAEWIERVIDRSRPETLRDVAVIYRFNSQSLPIQLELIAHEIPYYCRAEDNLAAQGVFRRLVAVLRYVVALKQGREPDVRDFVTMVTAYHPRSDDRQRRNLLNAAQHVDPPYFDAFDSRDGSVVPRPQHLQAVLWQLASTTSPEVAIELIASEFRGVQGSSGGLEDVVSASLPISELARLAARYEHLEEFTKFLERAVVQAEQLGSDKFDGRGVRLITYFRSKGLQFGTVVLPTVNEGRMPDRRSAEEDERRLFYVGITRATTNLWLSYVDEVAGQLTARSQFLGELNLPPACFVAAPPALPAPARQPARQTLPTRADGPKATASSRPGDDFLSRYLQSLANRHPID